MEDWSLAAYGEPRETHDVDIAVSDLSAERASEALAARGMSTLLAFEDVRFGGLSLGRVTLLGGAGHLGLNVLDLVKPRSPAYGARVLARAVEGELRGRTMRIVTAEDYVIFKALATRDRDLDDAASVLRRNRDALDFRLIDDEVRVLATEIPDWKVLDRWAELQNRA